MLICVQRLSNTNFESVGGSIQYSTLAVGLLPLLDNYTAVGSSAGTSLVVDLENSDSATGFGADPWTVFSGYGLSSDTSQISFIGGPQSTLTVNLTNVP
jgi:hypothetical protein